MIKNKDKIKLYNIKINEESVVFQTLLGTIVSSFLVKEVEEYER